MGTLLPPCLARLVCCLIAVLFIDATCADEIVLDSSVNTKVSVGDFDCSQCPTPTSAINLLSGSDSGELTAGQLWQYFNSQGFESVDKLTLCVDVQQPSENSDEFGLNSVELKIEDPMNAGGLLTNVSLGQNSLVFPNYDISSYKPEAKLEFALGYDFMERFSANSQEKISVDVSSNASEVASPVLSIEGGSGFRFNMTALAVFAMFWAVVFFALNRFTKPQVNTTEVSPKPTSNIQRVVSA